MRLAPKDVLACERDAYCIGGYEETYSATAYCSATCTISPDSCPTGFYCAFLGDGQNYCQPQRPRASR